MRSKTVPNRPNVGGVQDRFGRHGLVERLAPDNAVLTAGLLQSFNESQGAGPEPTSNGESGSVNERDMSSQAGPNGGLPVAMNGAAPTDPASAPGGVAASVAAASAAHAPEVPEVAGSPANIP